MCCKHAIASLRHGITTLAHPTEMHLHPTKRDARSLLCRDDVAALDGARLGEAKSTSFASFLAYVILPLACILPAPHLEGMTHTREDRMRQSICDAERSALIDDVDRKARLDGQPAVICGRREPFAIVAALDGSGKRLELSWPTVKRIMHAGGQFNSRA